MCSFKDGDLVDLLIRSKWPAVKMKYIWARSTDPIWAVISLTLFTSSFNSNTSNSYFAINLQYFQPNVHQTIQNNSKLTNNSPQIEFHTSPIHWSRSHCVFCYVGNDRNSTPAFLRHSLRDGTVNELFLTICLFCVSFQSALQFLTQMYHFSLILASILETKRNIKVSPFWCYNLLSYRSLSRGASQVSTSMGFKTCFGRFQTWLSRGLAFQKYFFFAFFTPNWNTHNDREQKAFQWCVFVSFHV